MKNWRIICILQLQWCWRCDIQVGAVLWLERWEGIRVASLNIRKDARAINSIETQRGRERECVCVCVCVRVDGVISNFLDLAIFTLS